MAETPEFQRKQYAFAAHIRDPESNAAPTGIENRRMAIYRELFFNNLHSLLSSTYPVLKKLHTEQQWRALIREFMVKHEAKTPYFLEIPKEFLAFLEHEHEATDDDLPFLQELAHYEWVELALSVAEQENDFKYVDTDGDMLEGVPVVSALAWSFAYRYPVHRISVSFQPADAGEQPTYLTVFRKADDELGFMEMNPVTARLLEMISDNERRSSGKTLLLDLATEMHYPQPEALVQHGVDAMEQMRQSEILLGVAKD